MSRRKTFEIPGVDHGAAPIPMAAQVGSFFHSSGIPPTDPATGKPEGGETQVACKHWLEWYPDEHDRPARHTTQKPLPAGWLVQLQVQAVQATGSQP